MPKTKKPKQLFTSQVESAFEGLRLEFQQADPDNKKSEAHRTIRKPSREDVEIVEKLIRAIESI